MNYQKYRWFFTSSGKPVVGGKNAQQNEEIVKKAGKESIIIHTKEPGSPFVIVDCPNSKDLEEASIFCASFSQQWKKGKKSAIIHLFKGNQTSKESGQKTGTFSVIGKIQEAKVELKLGLLFQQNKLRAVPLSVGKTFLKIEPGKIDKEKIAEKIKGILKKEGINVDKEEILRAIPSGKFRIEK